MHRSPHPEDPAEGASGADGDPHKGVAVQGDAGADRETPLGGDENTQEQLEADNEVEEDSLKTFDPGDAPA